MVMSVWHQQSNSDVRWGVESNGGSPVITYFVQHPLFIGNPPSKTTPPAVSTTWWWRTISQLAAQKFATKLSGRIC